MAEDLGAGELRRRSARSASAAAASLRSTRSSSTHLPCDCTSGRASAARRATSAAVSSTSSNTADQRTSLSWLAPTMRLALGLDEEPQRGGGLASRQGRHPHLEAGRLERRTGDGHQLPRLVLAQVHLAAAEAAGPAELVVDPLEADDLVGEVLGALAVGEGLLDREQPALGAAPEHGEEPGVALVGRVELDDERGLGDAAHLVRPLVEPLGDLGAGGDRGGEGRAVEAGDEGLARRRRRCGSPAGVAGRSSFSPASRAMASTTAPITSRVTVRGSLRDSTDDRPGHGAGQPGDLAVVDPGRRPAHVEVHDLALGVAVGAQARDDAALGDESRRRRPRPGRASGRWRPRRPRPLAAADRDDEPAERLLDRDRQRRGLQAVGQDDVGVDRPAELRARRAPRAGRRGRRSGGRPCRGRPPTPRSEPAAQEAWSRISPVGSAVGMSTGAPLPVDPRSRS